MPQSYDFIFISARDFCQKLQKKLGTHILLGKNLRHLRYLRDNEQVTLIHIILFVLNKKVLILFNTTNKMNKICTFECCMSVEC